MPPLAVVWLALVLIRTSAVNGKPRSRLVFPCNINENQKHATKTTLHLRATVDNH